MEAVVRNIKLTASTVKINKTSDTTARPGELVGRWVSRIEGANSASRPTPAVRFPWKHEESMPREVRDVAYCWLYLEVLAVCTSTRKFTARPS
ncbi:hypothetical protein J6590_052914 [Homalodisca vitripennis]|nr:hypothetical protein J6590_052914 [Homalodisca vitripennis]